MLTVSDPFAVSFNGVPGALPDGVYVTVSADGQSVNVRLPDGDGAARYVLHGDDGVWRDGIAVSAAAGPLHAALAADGATEADLARAVDAACAKGISPFGGF